VVRAELTQEEQSMLRLSREVLSFAGLPPTVVDTVVDDKMPRQLDGSVRWVTGASAHLCRPTIRMSARLATSPSGTVLTALHEAAHVLSGDCDHGYLFKEQWRRLSSPMFLEALERHLTRAGDVG
jgi:hypothetical protein